MSKDDDNNNIDAVTDNLDRVVISEDVDTQTSANVSSARAIDGDDSFECSAAGDKPREQHINEQKLEQAKNDDDVNDTTDFNIGSASNESTCANCGKGEGQSGNLKVCTLRVIW